MKYEYKCTAPMLPDDATSPVTDYKQMEDWLNEMDEQGWEFVGYGQKHWVGRHPFVQGWWVFRRLRENRGATL